LFQKWNKVGAKKAARCSFYRVVLENRRGSVNSGQRPMRCAPEALGTTPTNADAMGERMFGRGTQASMSDMTGE